MLALARVPWLDHLLRQAGRPDLVQLDARPAVAMVSAATVGAVLASRRPRHPVGWLLLALALSLVATGVAAQYLVYGLLVRPGALPAAYYAALYYPASVFTALALIGFVLLLTPTGSLPSPRWRWWARAMVAAPVVLLVVVTLGRGPLDPRYQALGGPFDLRGFSGVVLVANQVALAVTILAVVVAAGSLVGRFGRARGVERLQLRWVAIGAAILRYRLYDLDRIISRTLAYGLLTLLLGGAYAGVALGLGQLLGRTSSLAVAVATMTVAAVFQPARRRIQRAVDRRFNRRRHDAAQTIQAFSARLRKQVDLEVLTTELLGVVEQTMQPTQVSLWLRPTVPVAPSGVPTAAPRRSGLEPKLCGRCACAWSGDGVVPLPVPVMPGERDGGKLGVGDLDPGRVGPAVKLSLDFQVRAGGGLADQVDDHLVGNQRATPPVHRDLREQAVLDPVPLGGARREVAHRDRQAGLGGQLAELDLPQPAAVAVGPARIRGDQQPVRLRVRLGADQLPPAANGRHRERGGVVVVAHAHPALVSAQVVDAVGDRLADVGVGEVVHVDPHRGAFGLPLTAPVAKVADHLFLLGVDADDRLAVGEMLAGLLVEVAELAVTVGVLGALDLLGGGLQRVVQLAKQPGHGPCADPVALGGQLVGQGAGRPARPPQRRGGVAPTGRLDQGVQRVAQAWVAVGRLGASCSWAADATGRLGALVDLADAKVDRGVAHARGASHHRDTAASQRPRLRAGQQASLPLVQLRAQHGEHRRQRFFGHLHAGTLQHPSNSGSAP